MEKLQKQNRPSFENLNEYISNIDCSDDKSIFINPYEIPTKIVAIGDIHGDLEALFKILLDSELIDINGKWIATNTFLILTGDIFDRGRKSETMIRFGLLTPFTITNMYGQIININSETKLEDTVFSYGNPGDELVILKFLTDLNIQSHLPEFGNSRVILCCGNHEYWYSDPRWDGERDIIYTGNYFHPDDFTVFKSIIERDTLMNSGGLLAQKFACILKAVVVVGDCVFMHGGFDFELLTEYVKNKSDFDKINGILKRHFLNSSLPSDDKIILHKLFNNRNLGKNKSSQYYCVEYKKYIKEVLGLDNLNLIIGHTTQLPCNGNSVLINKYSSLYKSDGTLEPCITLPTVWCENQIYRIDTLISRMNGSLDYRTPNIGSLNSLIIEFDSHGRKINVSVMNSYILHTNKSLVRPIQS